MLTQIYVKDFILIDNVNLVFHPHMSAFTGETGAGKSLLMDAIGILKGDRINASMVKQHKEKAIIEGVFQIAPTHPVYRVLADAGYELEDETLIVTREFTRAGKSVARINQRTTNVSFLKEIVSALVDIHSQHDTQYLLNAKYHLSLLDGFCEDIALMQQVKQTFQIYKKVSDELEEALHADYNEDDLEFLTFQLNEIDDAMLVENELEELEDEQKKLMAFEKITTKITNALACLEGEKGSHAQLYEGYRELSSIHEDVRFASISEKLLDAYYVMEEQISEAKDYVEHMEYDEARFNELQDRIFLIHKILRKYGPSYQDVHTKRKECERKIDSILHRQDFITKQEKIKQEAYASFYKHANKLRSIRKKQAKALEALILAQLRDLELKNAQFLVHFEEIDGNTTGIDKVEFMISMNKGEQLKSLSTTASGGELSRLMLGLKSIFTKLQGIETVIFDEIDTGVSGSVAFAIGKKMQELGKETQVFCVTHLAAVAACADQHYLVEKQQKDESTTTNIRLLEETQRITQLAHIASNSSSSSAMDAAQELFHKAQGNR